MIKANVAHILKRKKLQLFFLFYILLILPLLSPMAQNLPFKEIACILGINILLFLALTIFSFFLTPRAEKILYTILLIITMIPGAMFLGYLIFARVLLEQNSITSLFETNPEESKEFVMHYFNVWVILGVFVYIIIPIIMIWRMKSYRPLKIKKYKVAFIVSLGIILCIVFISRLSQSVYFINFYNTFANYKIRIYNENKEIQQRQSINYDVVASVDTIPQTIVVVIGESLSRHHMQLYGYGRQTNPLLSEKNVYVYNDVVSPQVHTIPVIRSVLSFADRETPEYFILKPSIFELFNRAGYDTYFLSNQPFGGKFGTSYDVLLNLAQYKHDFSSENKNDGILLDKLGEILRGKTDKNRFIILHLAGNHMAYKFRYPKDFEKFSSSQDDFVKITPYLNMQARQTIDEYDNSVLYNDWAVASVIDSLNRYDSQNSAMIYFSDHAEELYDFRNFAGHAYEKVSPFMCEIPFIVWLSNGFIENKNSIEIDTNRPYSTADFIYSVSNLAGLEYVDYDGSRSIFSPNFDVRKRYVGDIPYSELINVGR